MMERLTKRLANGNVTFCGNGTPTQNAMMLPKIMKRLAEYEDAEDQGRLVRLPCKVGDTVWNTKAVFSLYSEPKKEVVGRFVVSGDGITTVCKSGYRFSGERFGKTVFLTREEAEEALRKEQANENE